MKPEGERERTWMDVITRIQELEKMSGLVEAAMGIDRLGVADNGPEAVLPSEVSLSARNARLMADAQISLEGIARALGHIMTEAIQLDAQIGLRGEGDADALAGGGMAAAAK